MAARSFQSGKIPLHHAKQEKQVMKKNTVQSALVDEICGIEWELFSSVNNAGGRASCQNDPIFFKKMRSCQFAGWDAPTLASYRADLEDARTEGRNPLAEKYAYMMKSTHPSEYESIKEPLQIVSPEKEALVKGIVRVMIKWEAEVDRLYPAMRSGGRPLTSDRDKPGTTSFETYLSGELKTYSERTLMRLSECVRANMDAGINMALLAAEQTALAYGYASIAEAEKAAAARL